MLEKEIEIRPLGEYQRLMERFETCSDGMILPDLQLVVRLDAHRYSADWVGFPDASYPFAPELGAALVRASARIMCGGTRVKLAFVHGDEISLLLDPAETANQRRRAKLLTGLASLAAVCFQKEFGHAAVFHGKLSELPTTQHVVDYFMWQRKAAQRNFLTRTISLLLAAQGLNEREIDAKVGRLSIEERAALASELGFPKQDSNSANLYGTLLWWDQGGGVRAGMGDEGSAPAQRILVCSQLPESDQRYVTGLLQRLQGESNLQEVEFGKADLKRGEFLAADAELVPVQVKQPKQPQPVRQNSPATKSPQPAGLKMNRGNRR